MHAPSERAGFGRLLSGLGVAAASVVLGVVVLRLASAETRWIVFGTGAVVLALVTMLWGVRRSLMVYTLMALTIDAHYYVTLPPPPLNTGVTSLGAITIPLALVPGGLLLAVQLMVNRADGTRLDWGQDVGWAVLWVMLTGAFSMILSSTRFTGICVLWQGLTLYALFLVVLNAVRTREEAHRLIPLLQVALLGQLLVFLLQLVTGVKFNAVGRVEAVAGEGASLLHHATGTAAVTTAGFATFLEPLILVCYVAYRAWAPGRSRNLAGLLFALGAVVVALTLNRSSWIGFPLGLVAAEVVMRRRGLVTAVPGANRRLVAGMAAVVVVFAMTFPLFQSARNAKHEEDAQQRFDLMKPAMNMITHNPIIGVGPGAYAYKLREYAGGYQGWLYIVHNDYLLIWAERGIVGFIAWLALIRAFGRTMSRASKVKDTKMACLAVGALAGLVVHLWEIFWTSFMAFPTYGVIYVLTAACAVALRLEREASAHASEDASARPAPADPWVPASGMAAVAGRS
jgi:O-antigen ligase